MSVRVYGWGGGGIGQQKQNKTVSGRRSVRFVNLIMINDCLMNATEFHPEDTMKDAYNER